MYIALNYVRRFILLSVSLSVCHIFAVRQYHHSIERIRLPIRLLYKLHVSILYRLSRYSDLFVKSLTLRILVAPPWI